MASTETALVTGASSGIGAELARVFARHGHPIILTGRSIERLRSVADRIEDEFGQRADVIATDLAQPDAVRNLVAQLAETERLPHFLVNSAGFGLWGSVEWLNCLQQLKIIDVNCRALTELTVQLLPHLLLKRGGILNVSSIGAFLPGPGMAVYFASKAFVQSFTESLRAEYRSRGLRVTALSPGPVKTRFQAAAGMIAPRSPRSITQSVESVALLGYRGLMRNRAVVVPGLLNSAIAIGGGSLFRQAAARVVRGFYLGQPTREERRNHLASRCEGGPVRGLDRNR